MLKNLETGELQDLSSDFPCLLVGSNFGDLALYGEWLVGVFACEYYAPYEIHALNLNSRELVVLPLAPGVPQSRNMRLNRPSMGISLSGSSITGR
ncbi:MAG: hypothetical protein KJ063_10715 [Anaerolineae bacterium]|nr:hypothetical protein [Anaerolineae bacterium]